MRCPSCSAAVSAGETICGECGTELVFNTSDAPVAPPPASGSTTQRVTAKTRTVACPDCAEQVAPDTNGLCPVCGHDFESEVEIDEEHFFAPSASLADAMEAERRRLQASLSSGLGSGRANDAESGRRQEVNDTQRPLGRGAVDVPLPGDRHRHRFQSDSGDHAAAHPVAMLRIEGGQSVFFDGKMTAKVPLDVDQLLIGRRDPGAGHYPEIDLAHLRPIDAHISRRHARVFRRGGRWFVEDHCENDATFVNDKANVLNGESVALHDGDRILISESLAMVFVEAAR